MYDWPERGLCNNMIPLFTVRNKNDKSITIATVCRVDWIPSITSSVTVKVAERMRDSSLAPVLSARNAQLQLDSCGTG